MNKAALAVALVAVGYLALASIVSTTILPLHHKSHLKHHQDHDGFEHEGNLIDHKLHKIDNLLKHKHHGHDHGDEHDHHGHKGHHDHDSEHEHDFHHGHDHDHDHEHEHGHEHRPKHHHHRGRHQAGKHHHHKGRYQGGHRDHEHEHQPVRQPSHHHRGKQQGGHHRQPHRHRKGGRQNGGFGGGHGGVVGGAAGGFRDQEAHRAGIENHNHIGDRKRAEGKKNFFAGENKGFEGDVHHGHEDQNSGIHKHQEVNTNKVLVKDQTKAVNDVDGFNNRHADEESAHVGAHDNKFAGGSASGKIAHDQEFDNDFSANASGEHNIEGAGVVGGAEIF